MMEHIHKTLSSFFFFLEFVFGVPILYSFLITFRVYMYFMYIQTKPVFDLRASLLPSFLHSFVKHFPTS